MVILVKQDFLRSSFVTDDTNMIQGSSASHLEGPHMGVQGGIDLMVHIIIFLSATAINTRIYLKSLAENLHRKEYQISHLVIILEWISITNIKYPATKGCSRAISCRFLSFNWPHVYNVIYVLCLQLFSSSVFLSIMGSLCIFAM